MSKQSLLFRGTNQDSLSRNGLEFIIVSVHPTSSDTYQCITTTDKSCRQGKYLLSLWLSDFEIESCLSIPFHFFLVLSLLRSSSSQLLTFPQSYHPHPHSFSQLDHIQKWCIYSNVSPCKILYRSVWAMSLDHSCLRHRNFSFTRPLVYFHSVFSFLSSFRHLLVSLPLSLSDFFHILFLSFYSSVLLWPGSSCSRLRFKINNTQTIQLPTALESHFPFSAQSTHPLECGLDHILL